MDNALPNTNLLSARDELDEAFISLTAVEDGALPLARVEGSVADALREVYLALGSPSDAEGFASALRLARSRTLAALAVYQESSTEDAAWLRGVAHAAKAYAHLEAARFQSTASPYALPTTTALRHVPASVGVPQLLDPPRPVLLPTLPLPERETPAEAVPEIDRTFPLVLPGNLAALEALMAQTASANTEPAERSNADAEGPATHEVPQQLVDERRFGAIVGADAIRRARAELALDELGMLAAMRRPDDYDAWTSNRECERRMLCRVDAIIAANLRQLPVLIKLLEDRPLPDPELTLAVCFVLGCLRGDDTRDEIARLLRVIDLAEDDMRTAVTDALALAPHPGVLALMQKWLGNDMPPRRALAVDVLARKRCLGSQALGEAAVDDSILVQRAAARGLRTLRAPVEARATYRLIHHEDAEVARQGMYGATLRGDPSALNRARELLSTGRAAHGDAALICALAGNVADGALLAKDASAASVAARGWHGELAHVPTLLTALEGDDNAVKVAAAQALHRITGAGLTDDSPEPDLALMPDEQPFLAEYREPQQVTTLSLDALVWRTYWKRHERRADHDRRFRYGRWFDVRHNLWELAQPNAVRCERERAYLELCARWPVNAPFDPDAFVVAQVAQLNEIQAQALGANALRSPWHTRLER